MNKIPNLKLLSGRDIPQIGLGTWGIGGGPVRDPNNDDSGQIASIKYAIDNGFSLIRTAHNYAQGYCEEVVGKAIQGYDRKNCCCD